MPTLTPEQRAATAQWVARNPLRTWRQSHDPPLSILDATPIVGVSINMIPLWEKGAHRPRAAAHWATLRRLLGDDIEARWDTWLADNPNRQTTEGD